MLLKNLFGLLWLLLQTWILVFKVLKLASKLLDFRLKILLVRVHILVGQCDGSLKLGDLLVFTGCELVHFLAVFEFQRLDFFQVQILI